ncbi:lipopolysaccharide biosynthesis protein [Sphingobacterium paludis]|uniref:O-antigen/teichoic acid export membrane protein n=1 Tax=Sphingobacterium paludis TaxID=1476465 RepID=A0A4R7CZB2_9SPHI|nr:oligosaccharide flippase family protein [Sphingobacterium paludis]TDS13939.1 O-antigen/teichoic acid export membrane protein [Sphingobacterium paludis]
MSVVKRFLGDTAIYGLSTIVSRLLNFVLTPLLIKKFPASVYGIFTNVYSWAALLNTFLAFGMETTYFRYLQKVEPEDRPKVFNNTFLVTLVTAFVFIGCLIFSSGAIAAWFGRKGLQSIADYKVYILLMGLTLAADALAVVPFAKLRSQNRPIRYAVLKLCNILVFVFFNLLFLVIIPELLQGNSIPQVRLAWFRESWLGYVFLSNLIASAVTLIMLIPEMKGFRLQCDRPMLKSMLSYSFPIFVANISFIINEHLDKILMPTLLPEQIGERDLGIYGAIAKIAVFLSIFVQAFRLGAEPFFFSYAKHENARKTYALIMEYFVIAMMFVMVALSINIEWLKYFIKGGSEAAIAQYWSGLTYIPIILFNYVLLGIYMNLSVWYKLSDQTRYGLYISGIGAVTTMVLCYYAIPRWSYIGAILVTTVTYILMVALSYFWGQKNYVIPYNVRKILTHLVVGATLVTIHYTWLDRSVWWGNALLGLYLVLILFTEQKFIRRVIRS